MLWAQSTTEDYMVATHLKMMKHSVLCVTGTYFRDVTNMIFAILHLNVSRQSICSSYFFLFGEHSMWNCQIFWYHLHHAAKFYGHCQLICVSFFVMKHDLLLCFLWLHGWRIVKFRLAHQMHIVKTFIAAKSVITSSEILKESKQLLYITEFFLLVFFRWGC